MCVEVCAKPSEVLERLLRERPLWQTGVLQEKVLVTLGRQTDIYQYSLQSMAPHPNTDYVVLRSVNQITLIRHGSSSFHLYHSVSLSDCLMFSVTHYHSHSLSVSLCFALSISLSMFL